ncbi:MAG: Rab family GTPase [Candidatus Hermodarchaeota archaeon]
MKLFKKWKKKRKLRYIPSKVIYEPLYQSLKSFKEDILGRVVATVRESPKTEKRPIVEKVIKKKSRKSNIIIHRSHYGYGYDATYKVVLFGDRDEEKTKLTQLFLTNVFKSDTRMTIGVDFEVKSLMINEKKVKLQIWDFEGEERFRFLLPTYVRGANGALFIYNAANYNSLAHIDDWLLVVRKEIKSDQDTFPIVVVGIVPEFEEERQVSAEQGIRIAKSRGVNGFIECSPKTGENVEETFDALTRLMLVKSKILI